jgi:uncharacterized protein
MRGKGEDARMTQAAKSQEPSMEEILASIRRIIADDDANKTAQRPPEPPKPPPPPRPLATASIAPAPPPRPRIEPPERPNQAASPTMPDPASDILDLTESMAAAPPPNPPPQAQHIGAKPAEEGKPRPPMLKPIEDPLATGREDNARGSLLSSATTAAVDSAFNSLAQSVLVQNARTLEDLVREMLRPLLKSWLDDNLPGLVERLVRAEIERVARGR